MDRLSEEVAQASVQTKDKRDRLKSARRVCQETAAAVQAKVEACANRVDVAVSTRGHPFLIHGNAKGQARHAGHFSDAVGTRTSSSDQHAKAAMRVAQAALYLYTQDVTRDVRAHVMEVRKANERIATATARRLSQNEDSETLGGCGEEGSQLLRGSSHSRAARTRRTEGPYRMSVRKNMTSTTRQKQ